MDSPMKVVSSALIVDDNEADVYWAKLVMGKTGRYPYVFDSMVSEDALAMFLDYEKSRAMHPGKFPPTLIFLDINMPKLNGFEFLEQLESIDLPEGEDPSVVLMLSSSTLDSDRKRSEAFSRVRDYVIKPLSEERAIQIAKRWGAVDQDPPAAPT